MQKYKVRIEGRNFLIASNAGETKHGFYTTRFVESVDAEGAEHAAVGQLRDRKTLREMTLNERDDPPLMYVTEIEELESFSGLKSLDQGLVWYPEEGKS